MTVFTKRAADVFAPTTGTGAARGADMGEAGTWGTEVEGAIVSKADSAGVADLASRLTSLETAGVASAFQGTWNASTNTPTIPAAAPANNGHFYMVAVAGATEIDGISTWTVGDVVISNGTVWERVPAEDVASLLATKEDRVSGITPATADNRLPIRNMAGDTVTYVKPDGSFRVPSLDVLGSILGSTEDGAVFVIEDSSGNRILEMSADAILRLVAARFGDSVLAEAPEGWLFAIRDAEGNIVFGVDDDGVVHGTGIEGGAGSASPHLVKYVFAEPYTDPSKDLLVTWNSSSADAKVMEWQVDGASTWQAVGSHRSRPFPNVTGEYLHTALLEGLPQNTTINVRWPGAKKTDSIKTCRREGVRVGVASDYQRTGQGNYSEGSLLHQFGQAFTSKDCDVLFFPGDWVADDGQRTSTQGNRWTWMMAALSNWWRRDGCVVPLFGLIGNHECAQSDGSPNNWWGGDGIPGMIVDILSCGYDTELPQYEKQSMISISIGREVGFVTIETDHSLPIAPQMDWAAAKMADLATRVRSIVFSGHSPAFHARGAAWEVDYVTQPPVIKQLVWPLMQTYHDKIFGYICGHEHNASVSAKLTFHYDSGLSVAENATRWRTDSVNGVRQLGAGMIGGNTGPLVDGVYNQVSTLDGSPKLIAAVSWDNVSEMSSYGDVDITGQTDAYNMWVFEFTSTARSAQNLSRTGHVFYSLSEAI